LFTCAVPFQLVCSFLEIFELKKLIQEIRKCTVCKEHLSAGVNPVISVHPNSKIAIIGQAPGIKVHRSGIPWDDKSGERLREWMNVDDETFYNPENFALVPMGFCYPGKGKTGDLPPRKECAPLWHNRLFTEMPKIELVLLIGSYAQKHYLKDKGKRTLTETVQNFESYVPKWMPLPHPSLRNNIWLKKNPWFVLDLVPILQSLVKKHL